MHIHWTMSEMMAVSILLCCYGYPVAMVTLLLWLLCCYGYSVAMVTLLLWLLCNCRSVLATPQKTSSPHPVWLQPSSV